MQPTSLFTYTASGVFIFTARQEMVFTNQVFKKKVFIKQTGRIRQFVWFPILVRARIFLQEKTKNLAATYNTDS